MSEGTTPAPSDCRACNGTREIDDPYDVSALAATGKIGRPRKRECPACAEVAGLVPAPSDEGPFVDHARTAHAASETTYGDACRWCGHEHDPEDDRCDAHAHVGLGTCPCPGEWLSVAYDKINAALYAAEQDCAKLRGELERARAATLREVEAWLREQPPFDPDHDMRLNAPGHLADALAAHFDPGVEHE